jgi:hypothetical protein
VTAPDEYFAYISISSPPRSGITFSCRVDVESSKEPPSSVCRFSFSPKEIKGGEPVVVTIKNSNGAYTYQAFINGDNGESGKGNGGDLNIELKAPNGKGDYTVTAQYQVARSTQACLSEGGSTLKVTEDKTKEGRGGSISDPDSAKTINTVFGEIPTDPAAFAGAVVQIAIGIAGGLAFLLMVFGAYRLIFAAGNPESIQQGREIIAAAVIGLLVVIFSVFILRLVGISILGLPL